MLARWMSSLGMCFMGGGGGVGMPRVVQSIFSRGHARQMDVITRYVFHGGGGGGGGCQSSPEHI